MIRCLRNEFRSQWKEYGYELHVDKMIYTSESIQASLQEKVIVEKTTYYQLYYEKLALGQPENWKCDQRTKDLFCLYAWLMDELTMLQCLDDDRRALQWHFNRKSRAEEDLFVLAAKVMNDFVSGKIDTYRGK